MASARSFIHESNGRARSSSPEDVPEDHQDIVIVEGSRSLLRVSTDVKSMSDAIFIVDQHEACHLQHREEGRSLLAMDVMEKSSLNRPRYWKMIVNGMGQ